jgi:hypothetical protein
MSKQINVIFSSHLTAGEIVEQLVHANRVEPIKNVVFMGMVMLLSRALFTFLLYS